MKSLIRFFLLPFILIIFPMLGCSALSTTTTYPKSDHFDGEVFFNPWGANVTKNFWDVLKWKLQSDAAQWPKEEVANNGVPHLVQANKAASVHVTYIGHATTYIQDEKINILTDPQFSQRASPVGFMGPKRVRKPALEMNQLPGVDFVLISHNHYDHLDLPSLKKLNELFKPEFIVPLGNGKLLLDEGIERVVELDWWDEYKNIQLTPAQHWSARGLFDRNKALWGGFSLKLSNKNKKIFYAGDTGYGPHFKMIQQKLGKFDLSILPIGAYAPRWFMKDQHMDPDDAIKAHLDLGSLKSYGVHFETFQLTDEAFLEPREKLQQALLTNHLSKEIFIAPVVGETLILE